MTREELIASAAELPQPPAAAAEEFADAADALAAELNRRMADRPDVERLVGEGNLPMMEDNSRNMARFLASVFARHDPAVLAGTALWVFRTYRMHGFQVAYWPANLDTFTEIARHRLSPETFEAVYPFLHWLIVNIPAFTALSDEALAEAGQP